jgi:hypothetical protein
MSRGPFLAVHEIEQARQLYDSGLTWRVIGERLGRDYSGLRRACGNSRAQPEAQLIRWRRGRLINANLKQRLC